MTNPILDFCRQTLSQGLPISSVSVTSYTAGASWTISLSIHKYIDDRESNDGIKVDRKNLPIGIICKGLSRWPDEQTEIIACESEVKTWIMEVAKIGIAQDWAKFKRPEDRYISYLTKPRSPAWYW